MKSNEAIAYHGQPVSFTAGKSIKSATDRDDFAAALAAAIDETYYVYVFADDDVVMTLNCYGDPIGTLNDDERALLNRIKGEDARINGDITAQSPQGGSMTYDPRIDDFLADEKYVSGLSTPDDVTKAKACIDRKNYTLYDVTFSPTEER